MGKQETNAPSIPSVSADESEIGPDHPMWDPPEVEAASSAGLEEMYERDIEDVRRRYPSLSREDAIGVLRELNAAAVYREFSYFDPRIVGRYAKGLALRNRCRLH
jgi:hypothetical protein